jgi:flavodoxin
MKALIVYYSKHGNTENIAQAIARTTGGRLLHVRDVIPDDLEAYDLLIFGSPTHGGFPSEGIHNLLKSFPTLPRLHAAAFDTRTRTTIFGYAAPKIAKNLAKCGASLVAPPEGFFVLGMEGPLKEGELERAAAWAKEIVANYKEKQNV